MSKSPGEVTLLLGRIKRGDEAAKSELIRAVYDQLRAIAASQLRRERHAETLQATALVHEAYMRMMGRQRVEYQDRAHFLAVAAQVMRRVLIDYARARLTEKRAGGAVRVQLEEARFVAEEKPAELLELDEVLKRLADQDPRAAQVVEMRFFAGLSLAEIAEALGVSARTVRRDWRFGRAWLHGELANSSV